MVRQVVAFVVRNWPLKLAAILLATLLYGGLIIAASAETFQGRVPVDIRNQPDDTYVLNDLDDVTTVRYLAIGTDRPQVTSATFTATVDLSGVGAIPGAPALSVPVTLKSVDPSIQVIDFSPSRIAVSLDPIVMRDVPVSVDLGTVPPGLDVREPVVSQDAVSISGPDSSVRRVARAVASIRIDPLGLDVNETVSLAAVDARGEAISGVDVQPSAVRVTIQIGSQLATRTLPVHPVVAGAPDSAFEITSVDVQPALVTVEGEADALAGLVSIDTRKVTIAGATADVATEVGLALPAGVAALGVEQARVTITIRPRTGTRTIEAGIEIVNGDPGLQYRPAVDRVLLTIGGTLEALDAVDPARITARLDMASFAAGTAEVGLTVQLPAGVTLVRASPEQVAVTAISVAVTTPSPPPSPSPSPVLIPSPTAAPTPAP
jgi:YbbR domain-containing protein